MEMATDAMPSINTLKQTSINCYCASRLSHVVRSCTFEVVNGLVIVEEKRWSGSPSKREGPNTSMVKVSIITTSSYLHTSTGRRYNKDVTKHDANHDEDTGTGCGTECRPRDHDGLDSDRALQRPRA